MAFFPRNPLPANILEFQDKVLAFNGVHVVFPLGRNKPMNRTYVQGFLGLTIRTFMFAATLESRASLGVTHGTGYASSELLKGTPRYYNMTDAGTYASYGDFKGSVKTGQFFSLALKTKFDSYRYIKNYFFDQYMGEVFLEYRDIHVWEYFPTNKYFLVSAHIFDESGVFLPDGNHPIERWLGGWINLSPGCFTVIIGNYKGNDPIRVGTDTAQQHLGRPQKSPEKVRITIQRTISRLVFVTDYGTTISLAESSTGVPVFSSNFLMSRVVHYAAF